jgi:basic membrane protein A and related proteins
VGRADHSACARSGEDWRGPVQSRRLVLGVTLPALLLALLLAGTMLAGCGGGQTTSTTAAGTTTVAGTPAGTPKKIAIIAPEKANDFGWNQQGVESVKAIAQEIGAQAEVSDGAGYDDISPIYRQFVANGADWIVLWASGYNTVGMQLAQETKTKTIVIGLFAKGLVPGLVTDFETNAQEGAYLAGVTAAKMSKTGTIGIVASSSIDENWNKMAGGFITGAQAARPDIKIQYAPVGEEAYADAASAKRVTESVIAAGADIILGMGDGSTFGMIQAMESATPPKGAGKVWFIDVIGDKTSIDKKGVILTSIVWDYLPLYRQAIKDIQAGTYGTSVSYLDLQNGGIKLLQSDRIPAEVWAAVETAKQGIIGGSIKGPEIYQASELKALLH